MLWTLQVLVEGEDYASDYFVNLASNMTISEATERLCRYSSISGEKDIFRIVWRGRDRSGFPAELMRCWDWEEEKWLSPDSF